MKKISHAIDEIHKIDRLAGRKLKINQVHPLAKLIVTVFYIILTVSFHKYHVPGLTCFAFYPVILCVIAEISLTECWKKIRVVLPFLIVLGIANPFLDQIPVKLTEHLVVWGGVLSMLTLILKGVLALTASFLFIATTGMERICYALRLLHIPEILVTQILFIYRYITVLLEETWHMTEAYSLRAPGERGIRFKVWGSLAGRLLLHSMDRSEQIYDSMMMRGFQDEFYYARAQKWNRQDSLYLGLWLVMIVGVRLLIQIL